MQIPFDRADDLRIGMDVGGTNTDAVVLDTSNEIICSTKVATTRDVTTGISQALETVLTALGPRRRFVSKLMLGTTHATNAVTERHGLNKVGVIRLGRKAASAVPPLSSWPRDLQEAAVGGHIQLEGGSLIDGHPFEPLNKYRLKEFLKSMAGQIDAVAITGLFSPMFPDQELEVAEIVRAELGHLMPVSLSHEVGNLSLLERENATVLNAALHETAAGITGALAAAIARHGLDATAYLAQNDGTLMSADFAARFPILTVGSGPSNSIRGAALLSGTTNAIVADVGGTTTDFGVLVDGFARESVAGSVIGGVQTNFPMPDVIALAMGGGSVLTGGTVGPRSVGYRIREESLCFGGATATLSDAAIACGRWEVDPALPPNKWRTGNVNDVDFAAALSIFDDAVAESVASLSAGKEQPLIVVGGGAALIADRISGKYDTIRPENSGVANAVGAAIALASGQYETIAPTSRRRDALEEAQEKATVRAIDAGADPDSVQIVQVIEVPLAYASEPSTRIRVKAAGALKTGTLLYAAS
ncbi:hydantoinase/oxoprolinase family protein [Arthrobacter sp. 24S4-2]|uniref:hydantoinase/oxoprolinase N-terminal domain-containing protein n=1 Tax=Arthrobacter sp. 24S4-2 TaxID=2575374 RepID=UPI0010C7AE57|nr:hydantoinase/oxoprolinase family protein [Arthrobacter sp. 24S4-2]QCO98426.1 hydantoinase/oxoprolinase family protein [Arthrobacter sp. 24S4-2]